MPKKKPKANTFYHEMVNELIHKNYRAYVGPQDYYDVLGAHQFSLLFLLGLREYHQVLDIGCGSLRPGRLLISYLRKNHYCGVEPEAWLLKEGIKKEVGDGLIKFKGPSFSHTNKFQFESFKRKFDFILAHSIFTHTSLFQMKVCLKNVKKVMATESLFVATYWRGKENYALDEWAYPHIVDFRWDLIKQVAKANGLQVRELNWPHPTGQQWILFSHPKRKQDIPELPVFKQKAAREKHGKIFSELML